MAQYAWTEGEAYEPFIGRWSRLVAREFISRLAIPKEKEWLDIGCGTGALTSAILELASPKSLQSIDPAIAYIEYARQRTSDARVNFRTADAQSLPFENGQFDAVVSGLVLNFIPDPQKALAEMSRVVNDNGTIALYVWDYAGKMELLAYFWKAATSLFPAAIPLAEARGFHICQPEPLQRLFENHDLRDIRTDMIDTQTKFESFDEFWKPFLSGQGPAPGFVATLADGDKKRLRVKLRSALPVASDGSIALIARAWSISGIRR